MTAPNLEQLPQVACRGCGARIRGITACHCGQCHATFGSLSGFTRHRQRGRCLDPASLGMVSVDRAGWVRWVEQP